jgi:hypothetical protein
MVAKNLFDYGSITKVPEFVLEKDFIKHTPYAKRSKEDDIPFWAKPFHIEYLLINKDTLEHILAFMFRTKQFQGLFGEAAFYHQNPGFDSTAGNCKSLQESICAILLGAVDKLGHPQRANQTGPSSHHPTIGQ